jgi:hypothetical protein
MVMLGEAARAAGAASPQAGAGPRFLTGSERARCLA